ncbi:MAG: AsnC family protein [Candidatus Eremiobacteraeota bacterium]|nr:AsnC family protein [Candidatus Eremiobacteraeota bacterium]
MTFEPKEWTQSTFEPLDGIDREILAALQGAARLRVTDIGRLVNL